MESDDSTKPRPKRRRLSRMSKVMLVTTGVLFCIAIWTLFLGTPQVEQPILKPPAIWSSKLPLDAALLPRVAGVSLTIARSEAGYAAEPQALSQAKAAVGAGEGLLLILRPGSTPSPNPKAAAGALADWIRREGLKPQLVASLDWPLLQALGPLSPDMRLAFATSEARLDRNGPSTWLGGGDLSTVEGSLPALVKAAGGTIWAPPLQDLRPEDAADAKAWGIALLIRQADKPEAFPSLLLLRPEALVTDRPQAVVQAIAERPGLFAVGSALE